MANQTLMARHKLAKRTEAEWIALNPVILDGEIAISSDKNNDYKVGDGSSTWSQLTYVLTEFGTNIDDNKVGLDTTWSSEKINEEVSNKDKLIDIIYPIGSIYTSVNNISPQEFLGGTWERIQGRFLLACDDTHEAGTTGGSDTHTLTTSEIPSHTHSVGAHAHGLNSHTHNVKGSTGNESAGHTHGFAHTHNTNSTGSHSHTQKKAMPNGGLANMVNPYASGTGTGDQLGIGQTSWYNASQALVNTADAGGHSHSTNSQSTSTTGGVSANHTHSMDFTSGAATGNTANSTAFNSGATGSGAAIDIMNPYLAVYMWKRTA